MERIATLLIEQYEYDLAVLSQPWMYWCLLIPAIVYTAFFIIKWSVLTAPVWLPLVYVFRAIKFKFSW